jgi:hypothetical protein
MIKASLVILSVFLLSVNAQSCSYESHVDYFGNDLYATPCFVKTLEECCDLCGKVNECSAWTYLPKTGACWLKSKVTERRVMIDGRFSGCKQTTVLPPPPPPCQCKKVTGVNYPGADLCEIQNISSSNDCCELCRQTTGCVAFAYYTTYKYCYLKSRQYGAYNQAVALPEMIYGVL